MDTSPAQSRYHYNYNYYNYDYNQFDLFDYDYYNNYNYYSNDYYTSFFNDYNRFDDFGVSKYFVVFVYEKRWLTTNNFWSSTFSSFTNDRFLNSCYLNKEIHIFCPLLTNTYIFIWPEHDNPFDFHKLQNMQPNILKDSLKMKIFFR